MPRGQDVVRSPCPRGWVQTPAGGGSPQATRALVGLPTGAPLPAGGSVLRSLMTVSWPQTPAVLAEMAARIGVELLVLRCPVVVSGLVPHWFSLHGAGVLSLGPCTPTIRKPLSGKEANSCLAFWGSQFEVWG